MHTKSILLDMGFLKEVVSDMVHNYSSEEFAKHYYFYHQTSSPYFPQSNGEAERAVMTVREILKKSSDPYLAIRESLLSRRSMSHHVS